MRRLPAFFLSLFFFLSLAIIFSSKTFAQTAQNYPPTQVNQTQSTNSYTTPNTEANVPSNLHTYTQSVMIEVMSALTCQLAGVDPTNSSGKCLGVDPRSGKIGFVQGGGGAVGVMGHMISMFYTPPAHTVDFIAYAGQNFGFVKHSYAANTVGVGLTGLSPLTGLWTKMRDIVYLLFVLVFVIVGVAIMLRVRIDPRTVMTIQNQIPKLIIALLLVTFSLAIAGFLIDIMYIFIYLIINVFGMEIPNLYTSPFGVLNSFHTTNIGVGNVGHGIFDIAWGASYSIGGIVAGLTDSIVNSTIGKIIQLPMTIFFLPMNIGCDILGKLPSFSDIPGLGFIDKIPLVGSIPFLGGGGPECDIPDLMTKLPSYIIGGIVGMIAFLVILIALIWALFRIWFALLGAYIGILIDVIFAPFWIVAGVFPGSSINFTAWLRHLVSNLSAFPAVLVMFILADQISSLFGSNSDKMFVPPLIGNPNAQSHFGAIIALGFILATPNMVKTMRNAFQIKPGEPSTIGTAIGAAGGAITGTAKTTAGSVFVYKSGTYPSRETDKGFSAVFRRFMSR